MAAAVVWSQQHEQDILPLGQGSNVVFTGDIPALVIHMAIPGMRITEQQADQAYVEVGAGVPWEQLVEYCLQHDLFGIENLTLIPGTAGAAPVQNIGAYGVELQDQFFSLTAMDTRTGHTKIFYKEDCHFAYRHSIFKEPSHQHYIICMVILKLSRTFTPKLAYPALAACAQKIAAQSVDSVEIHAATVRQWIQKIRRSKLPDPDLLPNAGSFFHNPILSKQHYQQLKQRFADIPGYAWNAQQIDVQQADKRQIDKQQIKVPAGWLIEQVGFKGLRDVSGAGVHTQQALVLVNHGGANGRDIVQLAKKMQHAVWQKFAISLAIEPAIY